MHRLEWSTLLPKVTKINIFTAVAYDKHAITLVNLMPMMLIM